jgi:cytochrome c oxidase cbb3-type subunit I/II
MSTQAATYRASTRLESFRYDDDIVRKFMTATLVWGAVAMLVGVTLALQLALPAANLDLPHVTFGRLRPLHTNAAIFAFAGNAIFAAVYHSSQRLLKARMFSDRLSRVHFWGWQGIILAAAITLPLGITQSREYAELEWPIDIAIAIVWIVFAVNFFGTIAKRRERHLYVAIWFYIATIVTVAILHVFNNLVVPAGLFKSYSIYAGVQDAFMQWWYGHNAVAFFLTTPFLGLMYYYLPKAANRPVFSYRLSILHFWSLVFIYIWAGPHHLHYTALPEWASTLGMVFSVMLWMPSWGGMINGLLTLRGAWNKVARDPVLKFFVVGITFYGMATFEGPMLSIKSVNSLSHYTDWTIAHVHSGALGWNGFMTFGMIYWLAPKMFQTKELYSKKLAETHFWMGTIGILFYIVAIYVAGVTQGLMWRAFDESGRLAYPQFVETVNEIIPMYWVRLVGGLMFFSGMLMCAYNVFMTWRMRPAKYEDTVHEAAALAPEREEALPRPALELQRAPVLKTAYRIAYFVEAKWHRVWERKALKFTIWVTVAVGVASLFEIIPTFLIKSNVPTIATVKPYTPLELYGRDLYIEEGCYNCHSQMVRPFRAETERYGEYSKPGEFVYEHPFQWGSRRIGPDLHRIGGKYNHLWHLRHMNNPRDVVSDSIMPSYPWMLEDDIAFDAIQPRVDAMTMLGVPYGDAVTQAESLARAQAATVRREIVAQGGEDPGDKDIVALIAYLQRLGTDIFKTPAPPADERPLETAAIDQNPEESHGSQLNRQ